MDGYGLRSEELNFASREAQPIAASYDQLKDDYKHPETQVPMSIENIRHFFAKAQGRKLTFLLAGRTGVGKSSTINRLLDKDVAPVGNYEATTQTVERYDAEVDGVRFMVVDTPGLCDDVEEAGNDVRYLELIQANVKAIDCMWFVSPLSDTRVTSDEKRGIKLITQALGADVWKRTVIVFTFAGNVSPARYSEALSERTRLIRKEVEKHAGASIASEVPSVAVDNTCENTPDGQPWLGELYTQVWKRISAAGATAFLLATASSVMPTKGHGGAIKPSLVTARVPVAAVNLAPIAVGEFSPATPPVSPRILLNEQQKREVKKSIDAKVIPALAALGIGVGATLGPVGAAIGGVVGGAVGLVAWLWE